MINTFRTASLKIQSIITLAALASYGIISSILEASYIQSRFPVPYFVQQTSFDAIKMKEWYAQMIEQDTFGIYLKTQFIDFAFIAAVVIAGFALWSLVANLHKPGSFIHRAGYKMAWALPMAGLFDVLENLVSFFMIADPAGFPDFLIFPYSTFAVLKFGCWTVGLIWLLVSLLALPFNKRSFTERASA